MKKGFQWFVAWRYLMARPRKVSAAIAVVAGVLAVGLVTCLVLGYFVYDDVQVLRGVELEDPRQRQVLMGAAACAALLELTLLMGLIRYVFTFFTSVSIGGVAIGTMALVIVLSVMSGFETDLRDKILGSNAHLRVTRVHETKETFLEYREVLDKVSQVPGVVAATPYLVSEVVIGASSSYANVVIKGVDPATVAEVTDLADNIEDDDETLLRMYPLSEDGSVLGPEPDEPDADEPDADEPDAGDVVDPAPDGLDVPDDDPVDFSGGAVIDPAPEGLDVPDDDPLDLSGDEELFHDAFVIDDEELQREARLQELADYAGGWPDSLSGRAYAGPRRHASASPRINQLDGVLVGKELVKNLHLYVGQEVSLVSPLGQMTPAGPAPRSKPYRIAGTFYTGMYEYDTKFIYVDLGSLQRFLSLDDEVNGVEIRVVDRDETEGVKAAVARALGPDFEVEDWKEINRNLFSALELEKIAMFLVLAIIILVASFSIIGNLIMVVVEKAREIALLKTLGAADDGIMKIFIVQGFFIGLVGTLIGVTNGLVACWIGKTWGLPLDPDVYYIDRLPIAVEPPAVLAVAAAGVLISVLATVYPAYLGARVKPVEGLRYE